VSVRIREIASGLQFPEGPVALDDGSIVLVEIARGTLTRVTPDGRTSVVAELGGGPNGAALGPDGHIWVTNNGGFQWLRAKDGGLRPWLQPTDYAGGRIERVNLATGRFERVVDRVRTPAGEFGLRGPNDLVFDAKGGLWFTDLGKSRARDMDRGGIYHLHAGSTEPMEVAHPVLTPNGIGLAPDGRTVYFAETAGARLWAIDLDTQGEPVRRDDGAITLPRMVWQAGGRQHQAFDSLKVDSAGHVLVATLFNGGITRISPDGYDVAHTPLPDRYVTNLCFGGEDLRTLYVTMSEHGKLVAIDGWPVAGLRLPAGR
jgi:gluconolactonase